MYVMPPEYWVLLLTPDWTPVSEGAVKLPLVTCGASCVMPPRTSQLPCDCACAAEPKARAVSAVIADSAKQNLDFMLFLLR
jgi:hypothetical protein